MKIPVTQDLRDYLHKLNLSVKELVKKGCSEDAIYRILRGTVDYLSQENSEKLAKALNLTELELLQIATQNVQEGQGCYETTPQELTPLIKHWHRLSDAKKTQIKLFIDAVLAEEKNEDCPSTENSQMRGAS